jgi:hypothetical protein
VEEKISPRVASKEHAVLAFVADAVEKGLVGLALAEDDGVRVIPDDDDRNSGSIPST